MFVIWKLRESPIRLISNGRSPAMLCPFSFTLPEVGAKRPEIRLNVVDLPAPFGPISAWRSPLPMERVTPRIISVWPNRLRTSESSSAGVVMRVLTERLRDRRLDLLDGIKVFEERGWAQVLPDPDEPLVHIYAEGRTEEDSKALEEEYRRMVEDIMESESAGAPV